MIYSGLFYADVLYNMYCARSKEKERGGKHNIQTQRSDEMDEFDFAVEEVTFLMFLFVSAYNNFSCLIFYVTVRVRVRVRVELLVSCYVVRGRSAPLVLRFLFHGIFSNCSI